MYPGEPDGELKSWWTASGALRRSRAFWLGVVLLTLPAATFYPSRWWVFDYAQYSIVHPTVTDLEHRQVHLGTWFLVTHGLFTVASVLLGAPLLIWSILKRRPGTLAVLVSATSWVGFSCGASLTLGCGVWMTVSVTCYALDLPSSTARLGAIPATLVTAAGFILLVRWKIVDRARTKRATNRVAEIPLA